jgi:hypothetical protein
VDKAALRAGAAEASAASRDVEDTVGQGLVPMLLRVGEPLDGSRSGEVLDAFVAAVTGVSADLCVALQGLGQGLESAAERFDAVDVALASSITTGTSGPGLSPGPL